MREIKWIFLIPFWYGLLWQSLEESSMPFLPTWSPCSLIFLMNLSLSLQFLSTFFTLAQGFYSSFQESTPLIIQKEGKDLSKHPLKIILSTPLLNGLENSITGMTSFFLFFSGWSPSSFSLRLPWMGSGKNLLGIPSKICGMLYFPYPEGRKR